MTDPSMPHQRTGNTARLMIVLIILIGAATAVYFGMVRQKGPRHLKLAIVTWTQDPFWQPLLRGAQDCANASNVDLTIIRSEPTVEAQTKHIQDLLNSGVDGIAISPNSVAEQKSILDEATGKVPVVTFDTDAPDTRRRRFVGIDNYAAGRVCADEMREALPDGGPILISVGSVQMQHGRDRRQGVIDGLLDRGFNRSREADKTDADLKGPKYSIVTTVTDGGDPAKAVETIAAALKAHPEVKGIIGLFSYSAPAGLEAIKQAGRTDKVQVVGFDESDETQAAILAGTIHSSILQDSYRAGYESIEVLADEARGVARGPAEQGAILNVGINVLTPENLQDLRTSGAIRQPSGIQPGTPAPTTKPATS
jgi:ribose transport system substrate-binding protein